MPARGPLTRAGSRAARFADSGLSRFRLTTSTCALARRGAHLGQVLAEYTSGHIPIEVTTASNVFAGMVNGQRWA